MAKQRDLVRMSEAETADFIEGRRSMIVATVGKDGAPHQTVLWFAVQSGTYVFETYGSSQKIMNLRRDPRVSLLWEAGMEYQELQGVSIRGRAEIIDSGPELLDFMRLCVKRNVPQLSGEALEKHVVGMARKRVIVVVTPEATLSWDHHKLAAGKPA